MITAKYLREILDYNPESGIFTWIVDRPKASAGDIAGRIHHKGYLRIWIDGRDYQAHRLAWLFMTGEFPIEQIDHRNLNRSDNSWKNLREASHGQNIANRRATSASGLKGAYRNPKGKKCWHATITHNKKCISLGYFETPEEAHAAYAAKASELHGEFARIK